MTTFDGFYGQPVDHLDEAIPWWRRKSVGASVTAIVAAGALTWVGIKASEKPGFPSCSPSYLGSQALRSYDQKLDRQLISSDVANFALTLERISAEENPGTPFSISQVPVSYLTAPQRKAATDIFESSSFGNTKTFYVSNVRLGKDFCAAPDGEVYFSAQVMTAEQDLLNANQQTSILRSQERV